MASEQDIQELLKSRYYKDGEDSWADIAERVSGIYPPIKEYILNKEFIPSTPTLMNYNANKGGTLSSCFPMNIQDSIEGILDAYKEAGLVTKSGGGVGYDFSSLRSSYENISSISRNSSGPLAFISMFSSLLDSIRQGGRRKGAGMAMLDIDHPDILNFIEAKSDPTNETYKRFNFSVRIPDWFYDLLADSPESPMFVQPKSGDKYKLIQNDKEVTVRQLWSKLVENAWRTGEPGIFNSTIAYDRCSITNVDSHVLSNPCQEHVAIPYSSCCLGSINLSKLVLVKDKVFNWGKFTTLIHLATRFLNNVIDCNYFPIFQIEEVTRNIRSIGLGIMGLAHALMKMGIPYNSNEAYIFADRASNTLTIESLKESVALSCIHGPYPAFDCDLFLKVNERLLKPELIDAIKTHGIRNHATTSIAPTGTISTIANTTSGIEPLFSLAYIRKVEQENNTYKEMLIVDPVFDEYITNKYPEQHDIILKEVEDNKGSCINSKILTKEEKDLFITARELSPIEHLDILAAVAFNTGLSVSKTINLPSSATVTDVANIYLEAHTRKVIGVTVYRDGSREGILVDRNNETEVRLTPRRPKELQADVYHFTVGKRKYYVCVGILNQKPYELFVNENYTDDGEVFIDTKIKSGIIRKVKRGKYELTSDDKSYIISNGFTDETVAAFNRIISLCMRHNIPLKFVVEQIEKTSGNLISFTKAVSRALKKYIPDGSTVSGVECPNCHKEHTLVRESGCMICKIELGGCGSSICG